MVAEAAANWPAAEIDVARGQRGRRRRARYRRISAVVELSCAAASVLGRARQLAGDPRREDLAQLHAPLVERVDAPDHALDEHLVLVQRDRGRPGSAA